MGGALSVMALGSTARATAADRVRAVVDEHYDFVWRLLRRLGIDEIGADDAAQHVFCAFASRCADVEPGKERSFLYGIVLRIARDTRRSHARSRESTDEEVVAAAAALVATPEELLDERRARDMLDALLEAMPLDLRTVFVLYEIEELTMIDIAAALSLPQGTVASRLRRARELFEKMSRRAQGGVR